MLLVIELAFECPHEKAQEFTIRLRELLHELDIQPFDDDDGPEDGPATENLSGGSN